MARKSEQRAMKQMRRAALREHRQIQRQSEQDQKYESERKRLLTEKVAPETENYDNATALYRRRKIRRKGMFYGVLGVLAVAVGLLLVVMLFFKVQNIRISGTTRYDQAALLQDLGVAKGDNLFSVSAENIRNSLTKKYPYIETVEVEQQWPDTLKIKLKEAEPAMAMLVSGTNDRWVLLSAQNKVLEDNVTELVTRVCLVKGVLVLDPVVGETARFDETSDPESLRALRKELETVSMLEDTTEIDMTDPVNITFDFDERMKVRVGTILDLNYKLRMVEQIIRENVGREQRGTIDARNASERIIFRPTEKTPDELDEPPQVDESNFPAEAEKPYYDWS